MICKKGSKRLISVVVLSLIMVLTSISYASGVGIIGEDKTEIFFLDMGIPDYVGLANSVNQRGEVVFIEGGCGVEQIADALEGRKGIAAVHILSHGKEGKVYLGSSVLSKESLDKYKEELSIIGASLKEDGDILFYGCNAAKGSKGELLINDLSLLTGADIAASNDLTGNTDLDADWELEFSNGEINTYPVGTACKQMLWEGILLTPTTQTLNSSWKTDTTNGFSEATSTDSTQLFYDTSSIWINTDVASNWIEFTASQDEGLTSFDLTSLKLGKYENSEIEFTFTILGTKADTSTVTKTLSWPLNDGLEKTFSGADFNEFTGIVKFRISITMGGGTDINKVSLIDFREFTIANIVSSGNTAPYVTGLSGTSFLENDVNTEYEQIDTDIAVTDSESADFDGGQIKVSYSGTPLVEDQLSVANIGNISLSGSAVNYNSIGQIGTASGGTNGTDLVIVLNAGATPAKTTELLRALAYKNTADQPTSYRTVSITVSDGDGATSLPVTGKISVTGQGEAGLENPSSNTQNLSYPVWVDDLNNGFTIQPNEGFTLSGDPVSIWINGGGTGPASLKVSSGEAFAGGMFDLADMAFDVLGTGQTYTVKITGYKTDGSPVTASVTGGDKATLDAIDLSGIKEILSFDVEITGTAAIDSVGVDSFTIANPMEAIGSINTAPVISGLSDIIFLENEVNAEYEQIDTDIAVTDSESADFNGGQIKVSYVGTPLSEDQLSVANIGNISLSGSTVNYNSIGQIGTASGGTNGTDLVIVLNAGATPEKTTELLRALAYKNTADQPTSYRTVSITVSDGDGATSLPVTGKISVTGQGEAGLENPSSNTQNLSYPVWVDDLNNGFTIQPNEGFTLSGDPVSIWINGGGTGPASLKVSSGEAFAGGMFDLADMAFDVFGTGQTYTVKITGYKTDGSPVTASVTGGDKATLDAIDLSSIKEILSFDVEITGTATIDSVGVDSFTIANPMASALYPKVTAGNISISGASGTGGAFKIGDTVTTAWNNTAGGDNNVGITGVTMDFSQFGGGAAVAASNSVGTWTATYTITLGAIDTTNRNVSVTATNSDGNKTTADDANASVDNVAPTVTTGNIAISGASGTGGSFKIGDTVTATWNNTAGGNNNSDTISGTTVDFSQFGGGAAVAASNSAGTWTATYTINSGAIDTTNRNVSVTAADNAGNTTTTTDDSNAAVDNIAPTVTAGNISISGASGTGGSFKIGDTVTATWNNTAGGDNNGDTISGTTANFSQFGGGAAVAASNSSGTWTATYTITSGAIDTTNRNVSVTAADNAGNSTTTADDTNATVDNTAPTVTTGNISISGASGTGGSFKIGDTVTATWNNTAGGDNNSDTISGTTVNFSQFGGGAAVAASNSSGTWTATYTINSGAIDTTNRNVSVTAADNAGNATTTTDDSNAAVDNVAPTVTTGNISISGASGTGGSFKIGDTVTATWNNTAGGDNNSDTISGTTVDFSQFGGGAAVAASNSAGTWTATYTINSGAIDTTNRNVSVTAADNAGNTTTTTDDSNAAVDNTAPTVTAGNISISGASGTGGSFKIGDTVTATWNNTAGGDNNSDTISGTTVDFSQFGGGAAVAAINSSGTWTATYTITSGAIDTTNRNVSVTAADNAGNTTTTADDTNATVDNSGPAAAFITINSGATYTNNTSIILTLSATDAAEMMVSEDSGFSGASYEPYATAKSFELSSGDGTKTVYIKYRDGSGNEASATNDTILLATQPPTDGSISIDGGATYTNNTSVTLTLSATGATEMIVSGDNGFSGASYEPYATGKSFTLSSGDGTKTVYVKYKDIAGNETSAISDSIILDTVSPTEGSISINSGAAYTNNTSVILTLSATDATEMMVSEDSGFSGAGYELYATGKSFDLSSGNGTKTVYIRYMDVAGNEALSVSDTIILDTTPPIPGSSGTITAADVASTGVTLNWTRANDTFSTQNTLQYLVYSSASGSMDSVEQVKLGTAVGAYALDIDGKTVSGLSEGQTYYFNVLVKDELGNEACYTKVQIYTPASINSLNAVGGDQQATLTFPAPTGATAIAVEQSTNGTDYSPASLSGAMSESSTSATVTGLTNGQLYYFRLVITGGACAGTSNVATVTPAAVPGAPAIQSVIPGDTQATIHFTVPASNGGSAITSYTVISNPGSISASGAGSPLTVTGLTNGITYTFTVKATNAVGTGPASPDSMVVVTQISAPVLSGSASEGSVNLSWSSVSGATGYKLFSRKSSDSSYNDPPATVTDEVYTVTGLENGSSYCFVVRAKDAGGDSPNSNELVLTPQLGAPDAPMLELPVAGNGSVTLNWSGVEKATGYNVYMRTFSDVYQNPVETVSQAVYGVTVDNLTNGITYYFIVRADNSGVESANSNEGSATPQGGPEPPQDLTAQAGNRQITLKWDPAANATGYKIFLSTTKGSYNMSPLTTITGTTYIADNLNNNNPYYFVVKATNAFGDSLASQEVSATPKAPTLPDGSDDDDSDSGTSSPETSYKADVTKTDTAGTTLLVNVNENTGSATVDLGTVSGNSYTIDGDMTITIPTIPGVNAYVLSIPSSSLSGSEGEGAMTVITGVGSITIKDSMLSGISGAEGKKAGIIIGKGDKSLLTDEVKAAIGNRPLVQLTLTLDGVQTGWNNPDAPVMVSIPYVPTAEELLNPEHIVIWYIDGEGRVAEVPSGRYNPDTGLVTFTTTHFSYYGVVYAEKTFDDLDSIAWAKEKIEILASKGILTGTSENEYSPRSNITRADFLYSLIKTLGVDTRIDGNFNDIRSNALYYREIAIAKKLGITKGTGNNKFSPDGNITRQEMMVLAERTLKMLGKLEQQGTASDLEKFNDKSNIAVYAAGSIATLVKDGLIAGSGDRINPLGNTSRAEAAVFLYRIYNKY